MIDNVKIGHLIYNLYTTEENSHINYGDQTINIKDTILNNSKPDYIKHVVLHEILHGIFNYFQIKQDEATINQLSRALVQLIKDNPKLIKFIKED